MSTIRQPSLAGFADAPAAAQRNADALRAPFPYFGGKSGIAELIWYAFGDVKQYVEPFCGSAAVLLAAPSPASLEVVGDVNCYIANFWRAVKYQPEAVASAADYPVSHIDLAARHRVGVNARGLDRGWCEKAGTAIATDRPTDPSTHGKIPHVTDGGRGTQSNSIHRAWRTGTPIERERERTGPIHDARRNGNPVKRPTSATREWDCSDEDGRSMSRAKSRPSTIRPDSLADGVSLMPQQIQHMTDAGRGTQSQRCSFDGAGIVEWMRALAARLSRVRLIHGDWSRCLNHHYGKERTAIFFDPPYVAFERLYRDAKPVALDVARWAAEHADLRIAVCGHAEDYHGILDGWQMMPRSRGRLTYGGGETTGKEAVWFSPACRRVA